jgi:hypothetical protein
MLLFILKENNEFPSGKYTVKCVCNGPEGQHEYLPKNRREKVFVDNGKKLLSTEDG